MRRRQRVILVLVGIATAFVAWELLTSIVAYTDDAYVRSDLVAVAPQVSGRITAVHVSDNQPVRKGDQLVSIDPVPFQLAVAQHQAEIDEARAEIAADGPALAAAQDKYDGAASTLSFAQDQQRRAASLSSNGDMSRQELDKADESLRLARSSLDTASAEIEGVKAAAARHQSALARARAEMALAEWRLAQTELVSPADGTVTALTVRGGDTARENQPLIGIVDAHAWRILANYKQYYLRGFREGATAWVWLDSQPWHIHRGRIASIARGISREADAAKLLPYVAPATDWIRLQRRFPVTITLEDTDGLALYMGADARTLIFP